MADYPFSNQAIRNLEHKPNMVYDRPAINIALRDRNPDIKAYEDDLGAGISIARPMPEHGSETLGLSWFDRIFGTKSGFTSNIPSGTTSNSVSIGQTDSSLAPSTNSPLDSFQRPPIGTGPMGSAPARGITVPGAPISAGGDFGETTAPATAARQEPDTTGSRSGFSMVPFGGHSKSGFVGFMAGMTPYCRSRHCGSVTANCVPSPSARNTRLTRDYPFDSPFAYTCYRENGGWNCPMN